MNSKCKVLHETVLKDILDLYDDIKDLDGEEILDSKARKKKFTSTSLSKLTSNLILEFPVICSRNMSFEAMSMMAKAIERKCVVMLQLLFSAYQMTDATDATEFITRFHKNIKFADNMTVDDMIDIMDRLSESTNIVVDRRKLKYIKEDMQNIFFTPKFNNELPPAISEMEVVRNANGELFVVNEGKRPPKIKQNELQDYFKNASSDERNKIADGFKKIDPASNYTGDDIEYMGIHGIPNADFNLFVRKGYTRNMYYNYKNQNHSNNNNNSNNFNNQRTNQNDRGPRSGPPRGPDLSSVEKMNKIFSTQLLNTDIKKCNELVPTTMIVNLIGKDDAGRAVPIDNIIIGVKARVMAMDSDDIINHVITKVNDKNWLLQFIRATTRETSFFRDFVFAIDRAKIDALSRSRKGSASPMWKVLERRSMLSKFNRTIGRNNDVMAITTIVVSQEEVDYVKKEYNIDIEDYGNVGSVMNAYNLMGFAIVDESLEVAKFCFDTGDGNWESYSFRSLERESSDNDYKKIINLMTKVSR